MRAYSAIYDGSETVILAEDFTKARDIAVERFFGKGVDMLHAVLTYKDYAVVIVDHIEAGWKANSTARSCEIAPDYFRDRRYQWLGVSA
jgi:hypothetical protein